MALTKRTVDALKWNPAGPGQQITWDRGRISGLGVRVFPSGKKSYVLSYRNARGRTRLMSLGKANVLTIAQARKAATTALAAVHAGGDPVAERQTARVATAKVETVKQFCTVFLERWAKPHRRSWREDSRRIDTHIIPTLGHRRLTDVTRADVANLHTTIGAAAKTEANRVIQLLRTVYNKASELGYVPAEHRNPATIGAKGIRLYKERPRERYVTPDEMPALLDAIDGEPNVYIRAAFWLYLLTGVRRDDLLSATWADVSFERRELSVPTPKGDPYTVPLSAPALQILQNLPRVAGNPHVFPGHKHGRHLVNVAKNWRAIRTRAGVSDVTIHDLRRTVGSWMATNGVPIGVVGKVLGHREGDVTATAIYSKIADTSAREALDAHGAALMAVRNGNGKPPPLEDRVRDLLSEKPSDLAARLRELVAPVEEHQ